MYTHPCSLVVLWRQLRYLCIHIYIYIFIYISLWTCDACLESSWPCVQKRCPGGRGHAVSLLAWPCGVLVGVAIIISRPISRPYHPRPDSPAQTAISGCHGKTWRPPPPVCKSRAVLGKVTYQIRLPFIEDTPFITFFSVFKADFGLHLLSGICLSCINTFKYLWSGWENGQK